VIVSILVRAKIALEKVDDETGKEKEEEEGKKKVGVMLFMLSR